MTTVRLEPRVSEQLNRALRDLMSQDGQLYLIGEDLLDPYGGAFKITKGLSTEFPDRVLATPLSEGGIVGVGAGLAMAGNRVIVEIMFGDFLALGFDHLLNFAAKSVSMYGRPVPVPLLVRCPVGANRCYGPTHSQSLQKHFIGIPDLALYELSPFHSAEAIVREALGREAPAILFEDKVLYSRRCFAGNHVDDLFRYRMLGGGLGWAHAGPGGGLADEPDAVIIAPGGVTHRAMDAARQLRERHGHSVHVVTPARLYPLDIDPVLPLLASAGLVCVAEESTAGGTWGSEVARLVYEGIWSSLRAPVLLLNSADSVIPAASHLERQVILGTDEIADAVAESGGWTRPVSRPASVSGAAPASAHVSAQLKGGVPIIVPKLNNNDDSYVLLDWLADEGAWVEAGTDVVSLEASKAAQDIPAPAAGYLQRVVAVGEEREVGTVIGYLMPEPAAAAQPAHGAGTPPPAAGADPAGMYQLDRAQVSAAAVVTRSHREVPTGFTVVRARVDAVLDTLADMSNETGAQFTLSEVVVKAVAALHQDFPLFFGSLLDDRTVALAEAPHVAVTVDVGGTLYMPVVRRAHERSVEDIADTLMDFRLKALAKAFAAHDLADGNIGVSLNLDPGIVLVHPIVMWPQLCMLSVGATTQECTLGPEGAVLRRVIHMGLAYDHRVINGRDAALFLRRMAALLEEPDWLSEHGEES
jgi:pyruvate/2-oxoglutarate/acetoin dehydrogenase E1 component/pyruvate/2-oxoglutarate dehydrogenase complex dihydrolipoamide acyltransferase (E2) component